MCVGGVSAEIRTSASPVEISVAAAGVGGGGDIASGANVAADEAAVVEGGGREGGRNCARAIGEAREYEQRLMDPVAGVLHPGVCVCGCVSVVAWGERYIFIICMHTCMRAYTSALDMHENINIDIFIQSFCNTKLLYSPRWIVCVCVCMYTCVCSRTHLRRTSTSNASCILLLARSFLVCVEVCVLGEVGGEGRGRGGADISVQIFILKTCVHTCMRAYILALGHARKHKYVCMHFFVFAYAGWFVCVCVCVCMCVHVHIHKRVWGRRSL